MCATLKVNCVSYVLSFQHRRSSSASFRRDMTQIYDSAESRECAFVNSARSSSRKSEIKISRDTFDITTVELLAVLLWNDFIPQLTMRLICLKLETQRFLLFCVSAIPPTWNSLTQPSQKLSHRELSYQWNWFDCSNFFVAISLCDEIIVRNLHDMSAIGDSLAGL